MKVLKPATALALTGIGTALVVGFQVPATPTTTTSTSVGAATTTSTSTGTSTTTATASAAPTSTASTSTAQASAAPMATSGTTVTTATAAQYADGTYTGAAVAEPWGTFLVQAVVSGGQLTDVVIVSAPQDNHSSRINGTAIPVLTEAAIASQSASLDVISGATWTSQSYMTSLQAALDAAQAAAEQAA
jgi:uncharacterized protein with FMN-binding domain